MTTVLLVALNIFSNHSRPIIVTMIMTLHSSGNLGCGMKFIIVAALLQN
jgi:hypothetical protein